MKLHLYSFDFNCTGSVLILVQSTTYHCCLCSFHIYDSTEASVYVVTEMVVINKHDY